MAPEPETTMADAMAGLMDGVNTVREAVKGYRASLGEDGWSPTAAEAMAMQLHGHCLEVLFTGVKGGMKGT